MNRIVTLQTAHDPQSDPIGAIAQPNRRNTGLISDDPARLNGFVAPVPEAAFRFALPFGVVIGDSISEGVPHTFGRLKKDGQPGFNELHRNMPGQLSYEFGAITGMHWFNHGIGGQRTDQVWARWRRDVLGEKFDPADARGDLTLPDQAYAVFVIAGINDVFQKKQDPFIQEHLLKMAKDARQRGIICIFSDMGEHNAATPQMREQIVRMNRWMHATLPDYGASVVDFYEWSMDRNRGYGVNPALFVDNVHPSRSGFQSLAYHYASQWHNVPLVPSGLVLEAVIDYDAPLSGFGRGKRVSLGWMEYGSPDAASRTQTVLPDEASVCLPIRTDGRSVAVELHIEEAYDKAQRSGFSNVRVLMGSRFGSR
jgi:lysophospholipase L1-like esterase